MKFRLPMPMPVDDNGIFDKGGGQGSAVLKPLMLTADEKKALKAFLVEGLAGEETPFKYPKLP